MSSLKNVLIPITLVLATAANATSVNGGCPPGWSLAVSNSDRKCCYGSLYMDINDVPYCCVGDQHGIVSTTAGCFTEIPFSTSDYSSLVSSASAAAASGSSSPATNSAAGTTAASTATGSVTSSGATGTADSTSNAALPMVTAHRVVFGGGAVVAALLAM